MTTRKPHNSFVRSFQGKAFQWNMLISIGGLFLVFAICFSIYQFKREKEYKIDIMHSRLQMYNYEMLQSLGTDSIPREDTFMDYMQRHNIEGLRITIIDNKGKVLLDSKEKDVTHLDNHLHRTEIQKAIRHGNGYDIKRTSESTHMTYFYSATYVNAKKNSKNHQANDFIIRAAVPYSAELTQSLQADNTYLYFALALTILLGFALYYNTSRISRHISYLREFAVKAEEGKELDHELERKLPNDELGDISHTIITLFWKLRHSEEDKIRIKRQLTQNAAHELKTPAASIHGYLESILDNPDMPIDKRQHFLERCYAQSERMSKLLLDMAALSKLDEMDDSKEILRKSDVMIQVDVVSLINNVLEDTALQLQEKQISPTLSLPQSINILGDQSLLYSIFRNLIDNVISYATGATQIKIESHEVECNGIISYDFTFSDNGTGVDAKHLPHLFERFYRVDKGRSRKLGGTGLGLAIVKNAVAVHGGTTTAFITPGGGLTIHFSLTKF